MTDLTTSGISGSPESMSRPVPRFQELLLAVGVKSLRVRPSARHRACCCRWQGGEGNFCGGYGGGVTADISRGHRSFNAVKATLTEMLERASMDVSDTRYDATILSTNTPR